jgi:hypothetical protein
MSKLKDMVSGKLFPRKAVISKSFNVNNKSVKVSLERTSPLGDKTYAVGISISDIPKFTLLTTTKEMLKLGVDPVDCKVFGLQVAACGLKDKLPQCRGCPLNHS